MLNNFSLSHLSIALIISSPLIVQPPIQSPLRKISYSNLYITKSFYSFLYSQSSSITNFKSCSFSKFNGYSPIFINSQPEFNMKINNKRQHIKEDSEVGPNFEDQKYGQTFQISKCQNSSVTFSNCAFKNCVNQYNAGGAIRFQDGYSSLIVESCQFYGCTFFAAGTIFFQGGDGGWIDGNLHISNSCFEKCYDYSVNNYFSGVIEAYLAKGSEHHDFKSTNNNFVNCQTDKKNKIVEGQIKLFANIFHVDYNNFTNDDKKLDSSSLVFSKYSQDFSTISFINAFNQRGFTFFEIYNIESAFVKNYGINMINTTFLNFEKDEVLKKVAFYNVYFESENCFFLDTFIAVDFTTINTKALSARDDMRLVVVHVYLKK